MPDVAIIDIAIADIVFNRYNSRMKYSNSNIAKLARSLEQNSQLSPVKVRPSTRGHGKYELVYGHRRVLAAKKLGWPTVKAMVADVTEAQMIAESLIENLQREELCDFEKAMVFERLHTEFGLTYVQIGEMVGLSKQHVCDYIAMLRLFDPAYLAENPNIKEFLGKITEHHARILARVGDTESRANMIQLTVAEGLSVRDLGKIIYRLRGWFKDARAGNVERACGNRAEQEQIQEISRTVENKFRFAQLGDYANFIRLYLFDEGYSVYPLIEGDLAKGPDAVSFKKRWFYGFMPRVSFQIESLHVDFASPEVAVVTTLLCYSDKKNTKKIRARGSLVMLRRSSGWKIYHEHWSNLNQGADVLGPLDMNVIRI